MGTVREMLEPNGYRNIQKNVERAVECLRKTFDAFGIQQNLIDKLDKNGQLADCRKSVARCLSKAQEMWDNLDIYLADYQCIQNEGTSALTQEQLNEYRSGKFWDLTGVGAAITGYMSYQFRFQADKSFAEDYNDLYQFKNGKIFAKATFLAGLGELSNYELWFSDKDFQEDLIKGALQSMIQGMPDFTQENRLSDGVLKNIGKKLGVKDLDKWYTQVKNAIAVHAANNESVEELLKDPDFRIILDSMSGEEQEMYLEMLDKVYKRAQTVTDTAGDIADVIKFVDKGLEVVEYCMTDYSQQVVYLDTMRDALLAAGYESPAVMAQIEKLRVNYTKDYLNHMDQVIDEVTDFAADKGVDMVKKQITKSIPLLKDVDLGLTILDNAADLAFADQQSAYKDLSGYAFMDYTLTQSYERYVDLMEYGVATQEDMEEADRIFQMLHSLKLQEYDQMRNLCQGKDEKLYELYNRKYEELKSFEEQYMAS